MNGLNANKPGNKDLPTDIRDQMLQPETDNRLGISTFMKELYNECEESKNKLDNLTKDLELNIYNPKFREWEGYLNNPVLL